MSNKIYVILKFFLFTPTECLKNTEKHSFKMAILVKYDCKFELCTLYMTDIFYFHEINYKFVQLVIFNLMEF